MNQTLDRRRNKVLPLAISAKVLLKELSRLQPFVSQNLKTQDNGALKLDETRENKLLGEIGYGSREIEKAHKQIVLTCFEHEKQNKPQGHLTRREKFEIFLGQRPIRQSVFFFAGNGSGKTTCMACVDRENVRYFYSEDDGCLRINVKMIKADVLIEKVLKDEKDPDAWYARIPRLSVDDIKPDTEHRRNALAWLFDERTRKGLLTNGTTRMLPRIFEEQYQDIYSRLKYGYVFTLLENDHRRPSA